MCFAVFCCLYLGVHYSGRSLLVSWCAKLWALPYLARNMFCLGCTGCSVVYRKALCPCGPKRSGSLAAHVWDATLLFTDPATLYTIACTLFAFLGATHLRLFFVFNILDVALYFTILRVRSVLIW